MSDINEKKEVKVIKTYSLSLKASDLVKKIARKKTIGKNASAVIENLILREAQSLGITESTE